MLGLVTLAAAGYVTAGRGSSKLGQPLGHKSNMSIQHELILLLPQVYEAGLEMAPTNLQLLSSLAQFHTVRRNREAAQQV